MDFVQMYRQFGEIALANMNDFCYTFERKCDTLQADCGFIFRSCKEISYYSSYAENGRNSILTNEKSGGRKVRAIASIDSRALR